MDIISDMTRQYKSVEEQLMNKINKLEQRKLENTSETQRLEEQTNELKESISEIETSKKDEINKLKKNIEEMS